jgi:hypothetical protein
MSWFQPRRFLVLLGPALAGCAPNVAPPKSRAPEPCTIERALSEAPVDARTPYDICPARWNAPSPPDPALPTQAELAQARSLLEKLCKTSATPGDLECLAARKPVYEELEGNHANAPFHGAFTNGGSKQALLPLGFSSVLFEWDGADYSPKQVLSLDLRAPEACQVIGIEGDLDQIACFHTQFPEYHGRTPPTTLDVHDLRALRTHRLISLQNTFLTSCNNVELSALIDLRPGPFDPSRQRTRSGSLSFPAEALMAEKPSTYDRSCNSLLQWPLEAGPYRGPEAELACALPSYTKTSLEYTFSAGKWQASPATEELLLRLVAPEAWSREITAEGTAPEAQEVEAPPSPPPGLSPEAAQKRAEQALAPMRGLFSQLALEHLKPQNLTYRLELTGRAPNQKEATALGIAIVGAEGPVLLEDPLGDGPFEMAVAAARERAKRQAVARVYALPEVRDFCRAQASRCGHLVESGPALGCQPKDDDRTHCAWNVSISTVQDDDAEHGHLTKFADFYDSTAQGGQLWVSPIQTSEIVDLTTWRCLLKKSWDKAACQPE